MNRNVEAAQQLVDAALTKLEMPEGLRRHVKQIAEIVILMVLQEPEEPTSYATEEDLLPPMLTREVEAPREPHQPSVNAIAEELTRDASRAIERITHAASLVTQAGASPTRVHKAVHDYLLNHLAIEQFLVQTLLDLPRDQHASASAAQTPTASTTPTGTHARSTRSRRTNGHA